VRIYRMNELRKLLTDQEYLNATSTIFSPIRYDDWRELIPNDIKEWWQALSLETRLIGYVIARDCYSQYETDILEETTTKLPNPDISPRVQFDDIDKLPIDSDFSPEDLEESENE